MASFERINQSVEQIKEKLEKHRDLLRMTMDDQAGPQTASLCTDARCEHLEHFRFLLKEIIAELEKTRQSFKSKRIEALRKRLENELFALR
jgi:hypothetical protein